MDTRVAILGIVIENQESVEKLNGFLHDYSAFIIGRMGVPYKERGISLISIMLDGPADEISALSGKIGQLQGVTAKAVYSKLPQQS
ncbi:MAG: iron-only hydrogenase system regulator [Parasporobacterium sp.]|nr:iron-only hydrogenase system regulator [Parasporobacterium sp.]